MGGEGVHTSELQGEDPRGAHNHDVGLSYVALMPLLSQPWKRKSLSTYNSFHSKCSSFWCFNFLFTGSPLWASRWRARRAVKVRVSSPRQSPRYCCLSLVTGEGTLSWVSHQTLLFRVCPLLENSRNLKTLSEYIFGSAEIKTFSYFLKESHTEVKK